MTGRTTSHSPPSPWMDHPIQLPRSSTITRKTIKIQKTSSWTECLLNWVWTWISYAIGSKTPSSTIWTHFWGHYTNLNNWIEIIFRNTEAWSIVTLILFPLTGFSLIISGLLKFYSHAQSQPKAPHIWLFPRETPKRSPSKNRPPIEPQIHLWCLKIFHFYLESKQSCCMYEFIFVV